MPVAILSTPEFDATTVDPLTVSLSSGPVRLRGNGTPQVGVEDVTGDGSITATVSAHKKAKASAWDVVIANTDGSTGACAGCFTVQQ